MPPDYAVAVFSNDLARWERCETEFDERGVGLPLEHRSSWIREVARQEHWFVVVRSRPDGPPAAAFPLQRWPTRALPGHFHLRGTHFGHVANEAGLAAAVAHLASLTGECAELLGIGLELFVPQEARRVRLEGALHLAGFHRSPNQRRYRYTPRLDLVRDEPEILASFSSTCRRFIRNPKKKGYSVDAVLEDRWAGRMDRLWRETFRRTEGRPPSRNWIDHLSFARRHPELYRIMGTFGPGYPAEDSLRAFVCARNHGDHAVYADGASTRDVAPGVALTYAPMWALVQWAKARGCVWFDMGGIPMGNRDGESSGDPRDGISDFKRRFTDHVIEVGSEWTLEPVSLKSTVSRRVSSLASTVRGLVPWIGR